MSGTAIVACAITTELAHLVKPVSRRSSFLFGFVDYRALKSTSRPATEIHAGLFLSVEYPAASVDRAKAAEAGFKCRQNGSPRLFHQSFPAL